MNSPPVGLAHGNASVFTDPRWRVILRRRKRGSLRAIALALAAGLWAGAAPAVDYSVIAAQNLFDPQRKPWPYPATAAAAAEESPLGPEDVQVQGVVVHAGVRRAIIRLGGRLRSLAPGGAAERPNTILREGQALGPYTLVSVGDKQLVFANAGKRFTVPFVRTARSNLATASPAPLPVIQSATLPSATPGTTSHTRPSSAAQRPPARAATAPRPATAPQPAAAQGVPSPQAGATAPSLSTPASAAAPAAAPPASGMTLLQAIQAAEAARRAGQAPTTRPPFNPFQPRPR